MMTVVEVVIECCHACTTKAARNFHKWWILEVASFNQTNFGLTTSHPIPFSNVCFTHLSDITNLILKNNHLWYVFFVEKILYNYNIPSSLMYPLVSVNLKIQSPVFFTGSPGRQTSHAPRSRPLHRAPWPPRRTTHHRRLGKWETQVAPCLVDGLIGVYSPIWNTVPKRDA